jgi:hypothetical protein
MDLPFHTRDKESDMKMRTLSLTLAAAGATLSLTAATPALAETYEQIIDRRQDRQEDRIDQGIRSGELNRREAARLERGQAHVNRLENRALADGSISRGEFRRIEQAQNEQSRRIYRQKHDRQHRPTR